MAYPNTLILLFDEAGIHPVTYEVVAYSIALSI
jgi:hypothetical protein